MNIKRVALRIAGQDDAPEPKPEEGKEPTYGGKGAFTLPADHVAAIQVPKGGSCCANCVYVNAKEHSCSNTYYATWNGGDHSLPKELELDQICSDWYTPTGV